MKHIFQILIILFILKLKFTFGNKENEIRLESLTCDFNTEWYEENWYCRIKPHRNASPTLTLRVYIRKPLTHMMVNLDVYRKANGYKPFAVNVTSDACKLVEENGLNPFSKIVRNWLKKFSNFNHTCPFTGKIEMIDFSPEGSDLPSLIPTGKYLVILRYFTDKPFTSLATIKIYASIKSKGLLD